MSLSAQSTSSASSLPTLYEYYSPGGIINSGLNADNENFTLNGKNITLYSGAMHYFRTPKKMWRDRLRKLRAAGLNTVETYIPWNLHEPSPGIFDFGNGGSDWENFLDIKTFLKTAQEEDLLAIVRPGPYICAEWEFGGFPSWLLREKNIKFRTSDSVYMSAVKRFFNALLPILAAFQFLNGGPIIILQVENEYASTSSSTFSPDKTYLKELRKVYLEHNITAVLATADGITSYKDAGTIPELFLVTANFGGNPKDSFNLLEKIQPGRPKLAMEYYPGWFDHWSEEHHRTSATALFDNLLQILDYPGSFNIYMFHGGTSFGFLNGANLNNHLNDNSGYQPDTTSYDYDSPLTEAGDYTIKYDLIRSVLSYYSNPKLNIPDKPELIPRVAYSTVKITEFISLVDILANSVKEKLILENLTAMELLNINNGSGQSYGYIGYRKEIDKLSAGAKLVFKGHVSDSVMVLLNGKQLTTPLRTKEDLNKDWYYRKNYSELILTNTTIENATLILLTENWGRVNYGYLTQFYQFKGLWQGELYLDDKPLKNWIHIPLEFKSDWLRNLKMWSKVSDFSKPGLYKGILNINEIKIRDTYICMNAWTKGIVAVNGFILGRYAKIGPQQCLYLPSVFIQQGQNELIIFEHYEASDAIVFSENQIWKTL